MLPIPFFGLPAPPGILLHSPYKSPISWRDFASLSFVPIFRPRELDISPNERQGNHHLIQAARCDPFPSNSQQSQPSMPPTILQEEALFRLNELFFSTTNPQGVIQYGNEVFVRVSGYSQEELFGAPHSLIRHPDMPRIVFKLLWDTIQRGETIAAYVKNLSKCGRYYWVLAVVMPCDEGYLSIRLKPSSPILPLVQKIYSSLRKIEAQIESEPKRREQAMQASHEELVRLLREQGFKNYQAFMLHALSLELATRTELLQASSNESGGSSSNEDESNQAPPQFTHQYAIDRNLQVIFDQLDHFKKIGRELSEKSQQVIGLADSIRNLSLNATIGANKFGQSAATMKVVAQALGTVSEDNRRIIHDLAQHMNGMVGVLDQLVFDVAATKLQSEVSLHFMQEMQANDRQAESHYHDHCLDLLLLQVAKRIRHVFQNLQETEHGLVLLQQNLAHLHRNNRTLRFVQFAGEKEAICSKSVGDFHVGFREVKNHIDGTKQICDHLSASIRHGLTQIRNLESHCDSILLHLKNLAPAQRTIPFPSSPSSSSPSQPLPSQPAA